MRVWNKRIIGIFWSLVTCSALAEDIPGERPMPSDSELDISEQNIEISGEDAIIGDHDYRIEPSYWEKSAHWFETSRDDLSENVDQMAKRLDHFFAGEESLALGNKSFMRLRVGGAWVQNGLYEDDTDLQFRLHLPAVERRFSIIVENLSENDETLEQKSRPSFSQDKGIEESTVTAALEFARTQAKLWKTRALIGIQAHLPADMFIKFSAKRRWELGELWTMPYKFKASHYLIKGWEIENSLAFERLLEKDLFFSATTELEWTEEDKVMFGAQIFSWKKELDDKRGVDYRFGIFGKDVAKPRVTSYFIGAHYRELLYKDWLYWNVIPELNFPEERDFKSVASFTIRFEVFFQK